MSAAPMPGEPLLRVCGLSKRFPRATGEVLVLDAIDMDVRSGEIVGILGRSGSGKSTLLRSIAGLVPPSGGSVFFEGKPVDGPAAGIAMVFQGFALFPWLTVLGNVALGLRALGVDEDEARRRSLAAIDLIGLDGFESAYPRELSGGMQQRVGFARALVVDPTLLLMDEPFSALDVLTAETLRTDFLDLWTESKLNIGAVILVTHNIEEAVFLCDRVIVLSTNPGRVQAGLSIGMPHPRDRLSAPFRQAVEDIYAQITARPGEPVRAAEPPIARHLRRVSVNAMAGLLETVAAAPHRGRADLPEVAHLLHLELDELLPVAEALHLLGLADVAEGDIVLTPAGLEYADADTQERKQIFCTHALRSVALVAHIRSVLQARPNGRAPRVRFETELEDHLTEQYARETLDVAIDWGRYAELYEYDDVSESLVLGPQAGMES
ncbi:MAG: ATP-binding cassette domain-containing protein [Lautropia sp.]|nr:MAG: ATP-binding cassette domain-containing protein [Pseudomonadota bacterium]MBC6960006.1 ATP-binding cassette domain-containing protein [Lautropia sp.]MCL4701914.1 AAA-associated domain-containing protein [Burkholderiaceae bacterium]MCZ2412788.1 nitrate/sulfonate/bicarbonate ABC transporter ATP-binding protein [Burkholderiales bacterium]MDL1907524.1 ATP-binding cassette domain-containing protein [Betaproteobacteria bacterium PRO1]